MSESALKHYGILGQKWGVRRTPEQLGHAPKNAQGKEGKVLVPKQPSIKPSQKPSAKKTVKKMSDDELRERINRLNMEEQYENLVARQKKRDTGAVKRLLGEAAENLGRRALGVAVDKFIESLGKKKEGFDIKDWKDADVKDMDVETIQKVSKWYAQAKSITNVRKELSGDKKG